MRWDLQLLPAEISARSQPSPGCRGVYQNLNDPGGFSDTNNPRSQTPNPRPDPEPRASPVAAVTVPKPQHEATQKSHKARAKPIIYLNSKSFPVSIYIYRYIFYLFNFFFSFTDSLGEAATCWSPPCCCCSGLSRKIRGNARKINRKQPPFPSFRPVNRDFKKKESAATGKMRCKSGILE